MARGEGEPEEAAPHLGKLGLVTAVHEASNCACVRWLRGGFCRSTAGAQVRGLV